MRQLLPASAASADIAAVDVDADVTYADDRRAPPPDRPWVVLDMITSVDGATAVAGRSGAFGSAGDHAVFRALRAVADVVLVGAGTARQESYGPPMMSDEHRERRRGRGQAAEPRLALVSRRLDFDPAQPLFHGGCRPLVLTTEAAASAAPPWLGDAAELRPCGATAVDLPAALADLRRDGLAEIVVAEGGPSLNAALLAADVLDEVCLSLAPIVAGGPSGRWAGPAPEALRPFSLDRVLESEGYLFLRYLCVR